MFFTALIFALATLICSTSYGNLDMQFKPLHISKPLKPLTHRGQNRQPIFISNDSFAFVSRNRKNHQETQIYVWDLKSNKEKRISHQRGNLSLGWHQGPGDTIVFSSTTDEDKETPVLLKKVLDRYPTSVYHDFFYHSDFSPQEIYSTNLGGTEVERLTNYSGYDGFPYYHKEKDRLYFSRWNNGHLELYAKSLNKKKAPWKVTSTSGHDLGLQISPSSNHFTWFRFSPDFKSSQILVSKGNFKEPRFLTLNSGIHWGPIWHPEGRSIIFSARMDQARNFDLYEVSLDGKCTRQLTAFEGDEFFPAMSPDGKTLLFTSTQTGKEQIHKLNFPPSLICGS